MAHSLHLELYLKIKQKSLITLIAKPGFLDFMGIPQIKLYSALALSRSMLLARCILMRQLIQMVIQLSITAKMKEHKAIQIKPRQRLPDKNTLGMTQALKINKALKQPLKTPS